MDELMGACTDAHIKLAQTGSGGLHQPITHNDNSKSLLELQACVGNGPRNDSAISLLKLLDCVGRKGC